ncbi:hypothetical protein F3Y22_tig00111234pilonHSYRG00191 [Hibiscus syriacus]|uniref:Uncharacterized protein n=1 Tax=Hibiscus syriacus TaxID=106335 RepID=A0A6A2YU86_HIBSY|nr:hypothetical protein F3Y22_tig00111234pilonHSYRG00191 [Hibiscus syriacus]
MGRSPCCSKEGLNRGAWTAFEDKILADYVKEHGLKRCGKSCRLRWLNYLRPDIKRAGRLPGRIENEIKNYWNTNLSKRVDDCHQKPDAGASKNNKSKQTTGAGVNKNGIVPTNVIRTRATRCSKVFTNPDRRDMNIEAKPSACSKNRTSSGTKQINGLFPVMSESDNEGTDPISSDFSLDFNMEEFCLSDPFELRFL